MPKSDGYFKKGEPRPPGSGRAKGTPNKTTTDLRAAILKAAKEAGGEDGLVGYLTEQATKNPQAFLPLLGKILPHELKGAGANGEHTVEVVIRNVEAGDDA